MSATSINYAIITFMNEEKLYTDLTFNKKITTKTNYQSSMIQQQNKSKTQKFCIDFNKIQLVDFKIETLVGNDKDEIINKFISDTEITNNLHFIKTMKYKKTKDEKKKYNKKKIVKEYLNNQLEYDGEEFKCNSTLELSLLSKKTISIYKSIISVILTEYDIDVEKSISSNLKMIIKKDEFLSFIKSSKFSYEVKAFISSIKYINKIITHQNTFMDEINYNNNKKTIKLNDDILKYNKIIITNEVKVVNENVDIKFDIKQTTYFCGICECSVYLKNRSAHNKTKKHLTNTEKFNDKKCKLI